MAMDSSSVARTLPDWRHDVFVSFRGEDTRKGFASHLFHSLRRADIRCYRDIERDERGQVVEHMLIEAIQDSRVAIIIFSTNYADSKWCLKELVEILKYNKMYKDHGHTVIPIFYDVEPSEVRRQSGKFGEGFKRSKAKDNEEMEAWRAALEEAGNISSWNLDDARDEAELIESIVDDLSNRIFYFHSPYFTNNSVGLDHNVDYLISLLDTENDDVRMIGIFGTEGIGKTTIAKAICSRMYNKFSVSLLGDIKNADEENKLVNLQKQLLQNILKIKHVKLSDRRNNNIGVIRTRLYRKKILLVLDNLDKKEQAYSITGEHDFLGPGSRILITTRDEQLLDDLRVNNKFMVPGLNPNDSLQLFCHHAFGQGRPREGYEELSRNLVHYVGGIPLAIETFVSFLSGKMREEWHQIVEKLAKDPHLDSLGVHLRSFSPLYPFKPVGPYGGSGRAYIYNDKAHTTVRKIKVIIHKVLRSIITEYDHNGSVVRSSVRCKSYDCERAYEFALDYPSEFLISISGYISESYGVRVIQSIKFQSNRRIYGPFGEKIGTSFTFPTVEHGRIVGVFGKCDTSLASIGAYFGPIPHPFPFDFGGPMDSEGETWDDKKHMDIRQINVVFTSSGIEAISVLYDNYGHPLGPFLHGEAAGGESKTVKLDYPYEYLTSISGYVGEVSDKVRVRSLTIQSNRRKYGPFGPEIGMHFPAPWNGGKIVGFFGVVEDLSLVSIKPHLEPVSHIYPFKDAGPFGGELGRHWDDGRNGDLRRIVITWERVINSIRFVHETEGITVEGIRHGGTGGSNEYTIELDYPDEYVGVISGYYGEVDGVTAIISLMFGSNIRTYGPFGGEEKRYKKFTYFRTPWNIGMVTGFYGRSGKFLNAIGAHMAPIYHKLPLKVIGPFGDRDSGYQWDDGRHTCIRQINLMSGIIIDSITCVYDDDGQTIQGSQHGKNGGQPDVIKLDDPDEYLRSISGHTGQFRNHMHIRSLTFGTNKRRFGPFGSEDGTPFFFESSDCKIVGFFGSSSKYLHSIGVHVEVLSNNQHPN